MGNFRSSLTSKEASSPGVECCLPFPLLSCCRRRRRLSVDNEENASALNNDYRSLLNDFNEAKAEEEEEEEEDEDEDVSGGNDQNQSLLNAAAAAFNEAKAKEEEGEENASGQNEEKSEEEEEEKVCVVELKVKWIKHYNSSHKILLVGEGDFSFSSSLATAFGTASNMIATSLDSQSFLKKNYGNAMWNLKNLRSMGCRIEHGFDATQFAHYQWLGGTQFDRIIYNFPFAGFFHGMGFSRDQTLSLVPWAKTNRRSRV
ncbi:hypothetical protein DM860_006179 [Cuscuta australis]|uniref:25S rRNA (uridine-N(3))-methyltransferase BMT5-like domain-containing protein n=1 Tax=Cuscuta australis TaxID=267555 RepID=A0A328DJS8_9ASTE|nr:hypothetical protein DM860_006179 [Cuscuta australis]